MNKSGYKRNKNSKIRHHAHTTEDDDPPRKRVKQEAIQGVEGYGALEETSRGRKRTRSCSSYVALLCDIIDKEEAADRKEWKDAMIEEYQSIMKKDIWDVVPRPKGKSIVTSKWIYKIKHVADGSIEKHKARFMARGFFQK